MAKSTILRCSSAKKTKNRRWQKARFQDAVALKNEKQKIAKSKISRYSGAKKTKTAD